MESDNWGLWGGILIVDEHEELPQEEEEEFGEFADIKEEFEGAEELEEDEPEEFIKYDDGQESFTGDTEDFEGINEIKYDSVEVGGGSIDSGGDGGTFGGIESDGGEIEINPAIPREGKLKNPFKFFKEKRWFYFKE